MPDDLFISMLVVAAKPHNDFIDTQAEKAFVSVTVINTALDGTMNFNASKRLQNTELQSRNTISDTSFVVLKSQFFLNRYLH